jgi:MoaA/NifB/PqqE/SkfB family radical SAM enzyme
MFSKSTFCTMPWSSILIEPSGNFRVCCFTGNGDLKEGHTKNNTGVAQNILTHSLKNAMNSNLHKEVRLAQSKNERHPICNVCWMRDDANATGNNLVTNSTRSFRTFNQLANVDGIISMENAKNILREDGSLDNPNPVFLDLRFANTCNMKCIMCNPIYSNLWYEDYIKLNNTNEFGFNGGTYKIYKENDVYKSDMPAWHDSPIWWEQLDQIKHQVRHIYLTGGEPFLVKGHDKLLDILIEHGCAKNIVLEYDTNLSVINEKILDKLKKFKQIILSVSCDDVEDRYELIRNPGKFSTLIENIEQVQSKNFTIRYVSTCVGMYSMFSPIRLHSYFSKNPKFNQNYKPMALMVRFLRYPDHSNIAYLPKEVKLQLIKTYQKSSLDEYWKNYTVGHLTNNLEMSEDTCVQKVQEHLVFLNKLDEIRGTDWRAVFPEVATLLKPYA